MTPHSDACMHIFLPGMPNGAKQRVPDAYFNIPSEKLESDLKVLVKVFLDFAVSSDFKIGNIIIWY